MDSFIVIDVLSEGRRGRSDVAAWKQAKGCDVGLAIASPRHRLIAAARPESPTDLLFARQADHFAAFQYTSLNMISCMAFLQHVADAVKTSDSVGLPITSFLSRKTTLNNEQV